MLTLAYVNKDGLKQDKEIKELAARLIKKWDEEEKIQAQKLKMKMSKTSNNR